MKIYRTYKNIFALSAIFMLFALASPYILAEDEAWAEFESTGFIRNWLLCGVFPNPPHVESQIYDHTPPAVGLKTDYLIEHGGEAEIAPTPGMTHKRPDGTAAKWFEYAASSDALDFAAAFVGQPSTNVVAYAYTTIESKTAGKVIMALGSDDGAKVWLNGKVVHEILAGRGVVKDNDMLAVTLEAGQNRILVKVEQGSNGWGLALRFLSEEGAAAIEVYKKLKSDLMEFQSCEIRPKGRWDFMIPPGDFPEIVWEKPDTVRRLMGDIPLRAMWFNNRLEKVTSAERMGRYLAYVEGKTLSGMPIRRALTIYCRPIDWEPWNYGIKAYVDHIPGTHIDPAAWEERKGMLAEQVGGLFVEALETEGYGAMLMTYLHEMEPTGGKLSNTDTPEIINSDYHVALKRKILGIEGKYPELKPPRKADTPAPVLRNGTPEEAGVKPDAAEKIRAVCKEWYKESEEPFVILVARHGVIVIHEVFDKEGGFVKLDTPMEMASITKAMTGMTFAQFMDQGLIDLDDPVGKYLPDFPVEGEKAITMRQCFTHTTGLDGHYEWGGVHNPWLDNVILNGMEYLTPGKVHLYNGMGYDLIGKVMEMVSGKSMLRLMQENFFEPLGAMNTTPDDLACCNKSTAEDVAKMGQLLLNKGSYGDRVFFSPETLEKMLPKQLSQYYPDIDSSIEWGVGLTWMRDNDPDSGKNGVPADKTLLSKNTIGHGAASSAILRVDLDNGVVVAQTRNTAGPKYQEYFTKFLKAIDDSIIK